MEQENKGYKGLKIWKTKQCFLKSPEIPGWLYFRLPICSSYLTQKPQAWL